MERSTECAQHFNDTSQPIATQSINVRCRRPRVSPALSRVYFHSVGCTTKRGEDSNKLPCIAPTRTHIAENRQSRWYRVKRSSLGRDGHKEEGMTRQNLAEMFIDMNSQPGAQCASLVKLAHHVGVRSGTGATKIQVRILESPIMGHSREYSIPAYKMEQP